MSFYNIDTSQDTLLYIDPNRVILLWPHSLKLINKFWSTTLSYLRSNRKKGISNLWSNLKEPNETHLGMGVVKKKSGTRGKGIGREKAEEMLKSIKSSKAFTTGLIADLKDISLFVPSVGPDNISDMITNIIKGYLMSYTKEECLRHGIPLRSFKMKYLSLSKSLGLIREKSSFDLPYDGGNPIIFVPKAVLSSADRFSNDRIYNKFILTSNSIDFDHYGTLSESRKDGSLYITKKKLREYHKKVEYKYSSSQKDRFTDMVIKESNKKAYLKAKKDEIELYANQLRKYGGDPKLCS